MKSEVERLYVYGVALRAKLLRWVGFPCGVGFAKTKILAKISNHIRKNQPGDLRDAPDDVLRSVGGIVLLRTAAEASNLLSKRPKACRASSSKAAFGT